MKLHVLIKKGRYSFHMPPSHTPQSLEIDGCGLRDNIVLHDHDTGDAAIRARIIVTCKSYDLSEDEPKIVKYRSKFQHKFF